MSDPVDPKPPAEQECHAPCMKFWDNYQACSKRIEAKGGQCTAWFFDYQACVDKCAAPKVFSQLK